MCIRLGMPPTQFLPWINACLAAFILCNILSTGYRDLDANLFSSDVGGNVRIVGSHSSGNIFNTVLHIHRGSSWNVWRVNIVLFVVIIFLQRPPLAIWEVLKYETLESLVLYDRMNTLPAKFDTFIETWCIDLINFNFVLID